MKEGKKEEAEAAKARVAEAKWRNGDQPEITTVSQLLDMLTHKVNNSSVLFFFKKRRACIESRER